MRQRLQNMYVKNKRVILRCDLNVPIKNGNILDNTKIIKSLETINYLINQNCKIIILSHLGRVKTEEDKLNYSLEPVKKVLETMLNKTIYFENILSEEAKNKAQNLNAGEILMLENTRFLDLDGSKESICNDAVAKEMASLAEVFVMDAFGVAHRNHTTVVGIAKYLPSCLGFLVQKELDLLDSKVMDPQRPFTVIMGGAKVDDKLPIIKALLPKCDHLLVAGGIANSFLDALGLNVGASLKTQNTDIIQELKELMLKYKEKFAFPLDAIVSPTFNEQAILKDINKLTSDDVIKDIGSKTINKYVNIINASETIFMNGTMGITEEKEYKNGTIEIFETLKKRQEKVVIGGGDTVSALNNLGFKDSFTNVLSGGGASLEYIANGTLPGIEVIGEEDNIEVLDL